MSDNLAHPVAEGPSGSEGGGCDQVPHCPELNAPGNIGCICLACVLERKAAALGSDKNLPPEGVAQP